MIISKFVFKIVFIGGLLVSATLHAEMPSEPPENTLIEHLPAGVSTQFDLPYITAGTERQRLDIYLPPGAASGVRPLVIFIHGGGWTVGSKRDVPQSLGDLLKRGYVLASLNYRLSQHAAFPAQIEDCKAAVRWLRAHAERYQIDSQEIGLVGPSAGGHLVALLGCSEATRDFDVGENLGFSSVVQAVIDYYGPTDLLQFRAHALVKSKIKTGSERSPEVRLLNIKGNVEDAENRQIAQRASPLYYVTRQAPPFLIIHGDADPIVPFHQSQILFEALTKAEVPVRLITIRGGGHDERFPVDALTPIVGQFFDHFLKKSLNFDWPRSMQSSLEAVAEK